MYSIVTLCPDKSTGCAQWREVHSGSIRLNSGSKFLWKIRKRHATVALEMEKGSPWCESHVIVVTWLYGKTVHTHSVFVNSHALLFQHENNERCTLPQDDCKCKVTTAAVIRMSCPKPVVLCAAASVETSLVVSVWQWIFIAILSATSVVFSH